MKNKYDLDKEKEAGREVPEEETSFKLFVGNMPGKKYEVYLKGTFEGPETYHKLYHLLEHASRHDEFTFYLNSYGGRLDAGIQFINKLRATKAHTRCIVESSSYSMGAIFPFACKETELREYVTLMFHNFSTGSGRTKGNEIMLSVGATSAMFKKLLSEVCGKVLTKDEIINIVEGKDLYLTREEIGLRMCKKNVKK